jgi:hypothetical protein
MASIGTAAFCAVVATAFWSIFGYALGRRLFPRVLAVGAAPVMGWAVHSALALPLFFVIGFSPAAVLAVNALCLAASVAALLMDTAKHEPAPTVPLWSYAAAAVVAIAPAAAIAPKLSGHGVYLSNPIFDHSKIAIVDAMVRQGLPPVNPIYSAVGAPAHLAYYYLWHFSAAEIALPFGISGWDADIGLTWFTAFASLSLMMALAVRLAKDSRAAIIVVILSSAGSLRAAVSWISGSHDLAPFLHGSIGFDGWLFQSAWAPQHLMSASCVVIAMLLIADYVWQRRFLLLLTIVLIIVAGFESSTYVGGITFAIAALLATPLLIIGIDRAHRWRFLTGMLIAAALVAAMIAPFVLDQFATIAARHDSAPVVLGEFQVLGSGILPHWLRHIVDLPAYWLIELPVQFPAIYPAGVVALLAARKSTMSQQKKIAVVALACLAGAGLVASWLLVSTLGDNNDLALRAVLPAVTVLTAIVAAGIIRSRYRVVIAAVAACGLILGLPNSIDIVHSDFSGNRAGDGMAFAQSPALWQAVRRYAHRDGRVANNPLYLQHLTPWPANMSWALLADRSSCFAGRELALAFAPLPEARREAINDQFIRVFNGEGTPADVSEMANVYGCDVVVVAPQDGAWNKDPFASSADYRLAETREGRWRIYVRTASRQP